MKGHTYLPNCQTNLVIVHRHSFQKWANLSLFYGLFWSFQTNSITFFTTNRCEKCPSSIQCWDSNPQPSEHESAPITTRPGLPPQTTLCLRRIFVKLFQLSLLPDGRCRHSLQCSHDWRFALRLRTNRNLRRRLSR